MLVLTRKRQETICIGDDIVIKVIHTGKGSVKIGIEAPDHIRIMRGEIAEEALKHVEIPLQNTQKASAPNNFHVA